MQQICLQSPVTYSLHNAIFHKNFQKYSVKILYAIID